MKKDKTYPGRLIVFEGIDGSGKTTLIKNVAQKLRSQGYDVVTTLEPGGTPLGKELLKLFKGERKSLSPEAEFLLFATDRAQHFFSLIIPALKRGAIILSDRMSDSSIAYQGFARGVDISMITTINRWVMKGIDPDTTIYLKLSREQALARILKRKKELTFFEKEEKTYWENVIHGYEETFKKRKNVIMLDANLSQDMLCDQVTSLITKK